MLWHFKEKKKNSPNFFYKRESAIPPPGTNTPHISPQHFLNTSTSKNMEEQYATMAVFTQAAQF